MCYDVRDRNVWGNLGDRHGGRTKIIYINALRYIYASSRVLSLVTKPVEKKVGHGQDTDRAQTRDTVLNTIISFIIVYKYLFMWIACWVYRWIDE